MSSEITRRDRSLNKPVDQRHEYGRGSKVKMKWSDLEYTLCNYRNGMWEALSPHLTCVSIPDSHIAKICIEGQWILFSGKKNEWKKIY
jgi:hypothetical protein